MKTTLINYMHVAPYILASLLIFTCFGCADDDEDVPEKEHGVIQALGSGGDFIVVNKTTNDTTFISGALDLSTTSPTVKYVRKDETLIIKFTPQKDYKDWGFDFDIKFSLDDKEISSHTGNNHSYELSTDNLNPGEHSIRMSAMDNRGDVQITAFGSYSFKLSDANSKAELSYSLSLDPDLMEFVYAELCYYDDNGNEVSMPVKDDDWKEMAFEDTEDGTTTKEIIGYYFSQKVNYNRWGDVSVKVIYSRKGYSEETKDTYDFSHYLKLTGGNIIGLINNSIYVNPITNIGNVTYAGSEDKVAKEDVDAYIDKLVSNPDVLNLTVNEQGQLVSN